MTTERPWSRKLKNFLQEKQETKILCAVPARKNLVYVFNTDSEERIRVYLDSRETSYTLHLLSEMPRNKMGDLLHPELGFLLISVELVDL